jgi:hypothetical protein
VANIVKVKMVEGDPVKNARIIDQHINGGILQPLCQVGNGGIVGNINVGFNVDAQSLQVIGRLPTDSDYGIPALLQLPTVLQANTTVCASYHISCHRLPLSVLYHRIQS